MPRVGNKEFAYTAKGVAQAKAEAKKTGRKVVVPKLNSKKIQDMVTGKKPVKINGKKPASGNALNNAIRKKTGTMPNIAN